MRGNIMSKKALCIGISAYLGTENDLSDCVNDCNDLLWEGRPCRASQLMLPAEAPPTSARLCFHSQP
jgi:hypothetical protein